MPTTTRLIWVVLSVLVVGQYGADLIHNLPPDKAPTSRPLAAPVVPVAPFIQALLDTTAAGSAQAADARLGLQVGAAVRAFYGAACSPAWVTSTDNLTVDAQTVLTLLGRAKTYGLRPADYDEPRLRALRDSLTQFATPRQRAEQQARFEVYLSDAVLRFMYDLSRGRLRSYSWSARERAAGRAWEPAKVLRAALRTEQLPAALLAGQPTNREYLLLQQAMSRWLDRPIPPDSAAQWQAWYEQVAVNLERWRWDAWPPDTSDYALVNLPAFELQVVAHDSVRRRHRVIVGKPQTPTPTLSSRIRSFTLAPDWHAPNSIAAKEFLPRLQEDAHYLELNGLALYDLQGRPFDPLRINWQRVTPQHFPYTIRQPAGCENALGDIVFRFPNPYSVYLHDTPMRQFFDQPSRAFSHGCIRLDDPMALAAYLLRREGRPVRLPSAEACARQPRPQQVYLRRPLPLYVRYATCAAEKGHLRFFADIYHRDEVVRQGLFGQTPAH